MSVNRTPDLHKSTRTKEFRPHTLAGGLLKLLTKSLVEHTLTLHYLSTNHKEPTVLAPWPWLGEPPAGTRPQPEGARCLSQLSSLFRRRSTGEQRGFLPLAPCLRPAPLHLPPHAMSDYL